MYFASLQQHLHRRLCKRNRPSLGRQLCLQLREAAVYTYKDRLLIIKSSLFKREPNDLRKCKIHAKLQNAKLLIQGRSQPLFVMLPLRKIAVLQIIRVGDRVKIQRCTTGRADCVFRNQRLGRTIIRCLILIGLLLPKYLFMLSIL